MRPVARGPRPKDLSGNDVTFTSYGNARGALIERMGQYCSYCNQKLPASLAVEHVQPKDPVPALELEWTNFLLGCTNCNSAKALASLILMIIFGRMFIILILRLSIMTMALLKFILILQTSL
ncbi:MAG: HNH endonuclease [Chitinophagaceae bacterium]